jgi:hypothetical protein
VCVCTLHFHGVAIDCQRYIKAHIETGLDPPRVYDMHVIVLTHSDGAAPLTQPKQTPPSFGLTETEAQKDDTTMAGPVEDQSTQEEPTYKDVQQHEDLGPHSGASVHVRTATWLLLLILSVTALLSNGAQLH